MAEPKKMGPDISTLSSNYSLSTHQITGSSQISSKVTTIIKKLLEPPAAESKTGEKPTESSKPSLVILTAKARYANKLISVVEIAKREFATSGGGEKLFQYSALGSEVVEVDRKRKDGSEENDAQDAEGDGEAFETIEARFITGDKKKRTVPTLTVYLSAVPVRELRVAYGEQR